MKRLFWIVLALLAPSIAAFGQMSQVIVTGTVLGATSGYVQFVLQPQNSGIQFFIQGVGTFAPQSTMCSINSSGLVVGMSGGQCLVWGNDAITPANTLYQVVFAPGGVITNRVNRELITGISYNLNAPVFGNPVNIVPQYQTITAPPVSVNLIPQGNNVFTLGTAGQYWASGYISDLFVNNLSVSGSNNSAFICNNGLDLASKITNAYNKIPDGGSIDCSGQPAGQILQTDPFTTMTKRVTIIMPPGTTLANVALHIPANVDYKQPIGGCLDNTNMTTFDGNIEAGVYPIFCGPGVVLSPNATGYFQWWGALGNGLILGGTDAGGRAIGVGSGCTGSATSFSITCATANFTSTDIGKAFDLSHAGASNCGQQYWAVGGSTFKCNLVGTIAAISSSTTAILSVALTNSVTNEMFSYGNPDDVAVQKAINSQAKNLIAVGSYVLQGNVKGAFINRSIYATGQGVGGFLIIGPVAYSTNKTPAILVDNGSRNTIFQNIQVIGTNELGELNTFGATPDGLLICSGVPNGLAGGCNSQSGISNLQFINCGFSYTWGIGLHQAGTGLSAGQQVTGIFVINSVARSNSYDGFNLDNFDNLVLTGNVGTYNGTGGFEGATNGTLSITGGQYKFNRAVGVSIGGFTDLEHMSSCQITGNDMSENGNGNSANTVGAGLSLNDGTQNCTISGNTIRHNHATGIGLNPTSIFTMQNNTIVGNTITSNGLFNASVLGEGINGNVTNVKVSDNLVTDESLDTITTAQLTSNVITVSTLFPHNLAVGNTVTLSATNGGAGTYDGTYTVATVPNGGQFTVPKTAANSGPFTGGNTTTNSLGFIQKLGIEIVAGTNSQFTNNLARNNRTNQVQFEMSAYTNVVFQGNNFENAFANDLSLTTNTPSLNGLQIRIPDIQTTNNACTTAAAAGATCTVVVTMPLLMNINRTTNSTLCQLDNTPNAQTGKPIVMKIDTSTSSTSFTVTIGTLDGNAAGGGTMRCKTNYAY